MIIDQVVVFVILQLSIDVGTGGHLGHVPPKILQ